MAYPGLDPVAFAVGPVEVRWYGLAYVLGLVGAALVLRRLNRTWCMGLSDDDVVEVLLAATLGVVLGARLGYVLFYDPGYYLSHPLEVLRVWSGGMSFHGGLAGIMVAAWVESRRLKVTFLRLCDAGAVGAPIGLLLGRLANFAKPELWGRVTGVSWGMVFPGAGPLARHPSQLYEAALEGAVLLVVLLLLSRRRRPDGFMIGTMVCLYGAFRIFVEFFREPDAQIGFLLPGATMGQVLSLPLVAAGAWLVWRALREERTAGGDG
ncbi:MAG: prolipoprotein diacylglyceryl transferase [Coriobacteriaceae bacterium]|nr:prolipoprotein diacylglyceryl transferase [Coriobacteriaceae bacterium]